MKKSLFTTGKFAELCETTKETLRHYKNIGLLKPEVKEQNGYQYYSQSQLYDYYLINTLKNTGCSLNQINKYINNEEADLRVLLEEQLEQILIEKRNIEKREQVIKQSINKYDLIKDYVNFNSCYISEEDDEYFVITALKDVESNSEWMKSINNHLRYCEENRFSIEYQLSYMAILAEEERDFKYYIASKVYSKVECERLHIKAKGKYIKYIHKGEYKPVEIYNIIEKYANENNLVIGKNSYESEVSLYRQGYEEDYVTEISVEIK
ncbi:MULTISPECIES: MerR family transcriptional regulator [unclassified Clostridium]|uniref:MerR family transcriptional regulator n=1 Tax=Clostridium TaxID=1485 RepID=UPI001C8B2A84|nr:MULTISPECIES: MerR family transcriptional regulator [unclassified Clostridium]MBX9137235.1 MerR family transcriptional regulator [Clostridium sp. K12(2020)]MBX9144046.1 MerR family transcriptional regulator [Clostridium sp. K13]MDU4324415.1 MerR family transcriptional regulator [Clostridium celatum]